VIFSDRSAWQRQPFDLAIICAGALNTPEILTRSGICSPHAGGNLTDHPMGLVAKLELAAPSAVNMRLARPNGLRAIIKIKDEGTGLWASFQLCPAHDLSFAEEHYLDNANGGGSRSLSARAMYDKIKSQHYRDLWVNKALGRECVGRFAYVLAMLEQEPDGCGSVRADPAGRLTLSWTISEASVAALTRSLHKLAAWLGAELHLPPTGVSTRLWSGAHYAGTCRVSPTAENGVVDSDLRVHNRNRIYACDASVLPSTGASHTGLTIGSLAMRLAEHLHLRFSAALTADLAREQLAEIDQPSD
jgi:choline dehydrogenase-like flavoprotein